MKSLVRVSVLVVGAVLWVVGGPVGALCQQGGDLAANGVPDFEALPGVSQLLAEGKDIPDSLLTALGFVKAPDEEYEAAFVAPKDVAGIEGANMFVGVNVMLILRTGTLPDGGATAVINDEGDRYSITGTASPAAGPSVWSVGDNGMISEVAKPEGIPGALTRVEFRSAGLDYDLYFYHGAGGAILERIMRKDGADKAPGWIVAVEKNDVHYLKTIAADVKSAGAVKTP